MASKKDINDAWEKAHTIRGKNPDVFRKDSEGNTIRKASYGTQGDYGWHLDHKKPLARGGTDNPRNIQPLHHQANLEKSDKYPKKKR